jgi:DNA-binding NtrC family response regulator
VSEILIIDDEQGIRDPLCHFLRSLGHDCVEASDGAEALGLLVAREFDLIISDVMMPRVNGFQLLEAIGPYIKGETPFLYLSSIQDGEGVENAIYAGADDYLFKPCEAERVEAVVSRALALREENLVRRGPYAKPVLVPEAVAERAAQQARTGVQHAIPSGAPALRGVDQVLKVVRPAADGGDPRHRTQVEMDRRGTGLLGWLRGLFGPR